MQQKFEVGDKVVIEQQRAVVTDVDKEGRVVHALLDSGCGWYRPRHVAKTTVE